MYHIVLIQGGIEAIVASCKLLDDAGFVIKAFRRRDPNSTYGLYHENEERICQSMLH